MRAAGTIAGRKAGRGAIVRALAHFGGGAGSRVRAGGCGLPELDLEGEERVEELVADEESRVATAGRGFGIPGYSE